MILNETITVTGNDPELQRTCPKCGSVILYKSKYSLAAGEVAKAECFECRNKAKTGISIKRSLPPKRVGYNPGRNSCYYFTRWVQYRG